MTEQFQPIVFNPGEKRWYVTGSSRRRCDLPDEQYFIGPSGVVGQSRGNASERYLVTTITPCEPPKAFVLGEQVIANVKEEDRGRIIGFGCPEKGAYFQRSSSGNTTLAATMSINSPFVLFSPPAPESKSVDELPNELLDELERKVEDQVAIAEDCSIAKVCRDGIQYMRERLADIE